MAKCKVVHIGVFFDGTGNNKANDKKNGSQSNIAKLSDLYMKGEVEGLSSESCDHYADMIYKNGVGTEDDERKCVQDKFDKGAGGGGAKRINEAIEKLVVLLDDDGDYPAVLVEGGSGYRERIIDVFGFSRGAAMARDFINTFNQRNGDYFTVKKVRFNFVGLYDTVGSFGKAGNDINYKPKDPTKDRESVWSENDKSDKFELYNFHLTMKSAEKIVHMVASHEVRENFPLSSIEGSGHTEWMYGGVHSDIGGGYLPNEVEPHSYRIGKFNTKVEASTASQEAKEKDPSWDISTNTVQASRGGATSYHVNASKERNVTNDLTHITFHRMHEMACECIVPLLPIDTSMPECMKEYDSHTENNPSNAMSYENIEALREKYFHHSAVDQNKSDTYYDGHTGVMAALLRDSPDGIGGNDTRYVNGESKREVYKNTASKAIPPLQKDT